MTNYWVCDLESCASLIRRVKITAQDGDLSSIPAADSWFARIYEWYPALFPHLDAEIRMSFGIQCLIPGLVDYFSFNVKEPDVELLELTFEDAMERRKEHYRPNSRDFELIEIEEKDMAGFVDMLRAREKDRDGW
ncbi:hypothetical protein CLAFUW4_02602 [Fulvia fulva]|uniref:uncharacterized protein n=1 Tax=Passalora fulva TaxID=5499 RepID=UPI0028526AA5|nr:uncharacterized protein CLAFUR5_20144 [Fulvia fulva]KAK4633228.1 hypothetical protein CLAFUR0_02599 [Fulvia fulva]WMI38782.1 hypothetical protein CLAFUR5_20144 [Fulvia fulva]WPV10803.1 hypothetical protein CLAFUW4_02602 [Fulvia fulva]